MQSNGPTDAFMSIGNRTMWTIVSGTPIPEQTEGLEKIWDMCEKCPACRAGCFVHDLWAAARLSTGQARQHRSPRPKRGMKVTNRTNHKLQMSTFICEQIIGANAKN